MKRDNATPVRAMRKKSREHRKGKRKHIIEGLSSIGHTDIQTQEKCH